MLAAARQAGIDPGNIISGYRSNANQTEIYARTHQGRDQPAAPPGDSMHNFGLATDINSPDIQKLRAFANAHPEYGIYPLPGDTPHFQLAGNQHALMANPPQLPDGATFDASKALAQYVAPGYSLIDDNKQHPNIAGQTVLNFTGPSRPASATPGTSLTSTQLPGAGDSHSQFIIDYAKKIGVDPNLALGIAGAEGLNAWSAKNPNAASGVDVTNGQPFSFGDFQLNTRNGLGTQALKAGIDPRDPAQWQAADKFALDQMKAGGVGPWKGDPVAAAYLKSGAVPEATGPMDPTAQAGGPGAPLGTPGSTVNPPIPSTPGTTINSTPAAAPAGVSQGQQTQLAQNVKQMLGLPDDDHQGQQQIEPSKMIQGPGARNVSPFLGGPGGIGQGQVEPAYAQKMASLNQPMTWGAAPPGQMPGTGYGAAPQPSVYGTSLMSNLGRSLDPMWMNSWGT